MYRTLCSLCIGIIVTTSVSVYAQTASDLRASVDSLQSQIQSLDKEIQEYTTKVQSSQGQAKTLQQALAQLENRRGELLVKIKKTNLQIEQAEKKITLTEGEITQTKTILDTNKRALEEMLRSMMYQYDAMSPLLSLMSSQRDSLFESLDALKKSADISQAVGNKVADVRETTRNLEEAQENYKEHKEQLISLTDTLSQQKGLIEQNKHEKNVLLVETKNKESEYQKVLADRQKKKVALEQEMLDMESKLNVPVDPTKVPAYGKGILRYPLDKVNITQYFGNTPFSSKNPQIYNGAGHNGMDFAAPIGTPILSVRDGVVVGAGDTDIACRGASYGKWVLVQHNNGLSSVYGHLSSILVTPGQKVVSGEKVGLSGKSGYSTGPHLHFSVFLTAAVHITGPTEYKSKVCGTYLILPIAPRAGYLNPMSYF